MLLILLASYMSVYIIVSVTSLYSSHLTGSFLPAVGPMPKKEELLRNPKAFAMACWPMLQLPNRSCSLFIYVLLFILISKFILKKSSRTSLPWFQRKHENKQPGAMRKLSPSQSPKNQVTRDTCSHLSKAASQHPPPTFSLARIKSKATPTSTTSAKEESPHGLQRATRWRAEESSCLPVLSVTSFSSLPLHLRAPSAAVTPGLRQVDVRSPLYTEQRF